MHSKLSQHYNHLMSHFVRDERERERETPDFKRIPSKMTDPAVGASTRASGNQI